MPAYRIEISPNNRAGCQDKVCKEEGKKLMKGEIRFAVWVDLPGEAGHGSWKWRHWGCISGSTVVHLQDAIKRGDDYDWDAIDGYDELGDHPDVQEKIRRVVGQGHIDDEDFNGDLEFNKPGKVGIRGRARKVKPKDEDEDGDESPKKPAKRGRKKVDADEDEDEEEAPAKKKTKKASASASTPKDKPAAKAKGKKVVKDEDEDDEPKPAAVKKSRAKKAVKAEDDDDDDGKVAAAPPVKSKSRKVTKKAPTPSEDEPEEDEPAPKAKAKAGRKSKAADVTDGPPSTAKPKRARRSAA